MAAVVVVMTRVRNVGSGWEVGEKGQEEEEECCLVGRELFL